MPQLTASGEIFRLDARAGFDEGLVRGEVGAGVRMDFRGQFELCHGLRGALSADVAAEARVRLAGLLVLAGYAEGEALAAAGVSVDAGVQIDLFDAFGGSVEAAAFAELAVAGRVAAGLTFEDLARAARPLMSALAYDLFVLFLNELDVVAGVWGKAAFAAMAKARLRFRGSLADDREAGFVCEAGAEAGMGAGAGWEFYAALRLRNPKRFFLNAGERISRELVETAQRTLPAEMAPAIQGLELLLPATLNTAYELGQALPLNTLLPPDQAVGPFVTNLVAQLQRFAFDKLVEAAVRLLDTWLKEFLPSTIARLAATERRNARQVVDALRAQLRGSTEVSPVVVFGQLADLLVRLAPDTAAAWRGPLTAGWLAAAAAEGVRSGIGQATASASAGLVGLGSATAVAVAVPLPPAPAIVRQELEAFFEPDPPRLEVRHAVAYLTGSGAVLAVSLVPGVSALLAPLQEAFGIGAAELLQAAVAGALGENLAATTLYQRLREFAEKTFDVRIAGALLPELRRVLGATSDGRVWIDEVAEPSLGLVRHFVFARLDALVAGTVGASEVSPFAASFRAALSATVGEVFVRNAVVVADLCREHALDGLAQGMRDLAVVLRTAPNHPTVAAAHQLARSLLPPAVPLPAAYPRIVANLAGDLLEAAAAGVDPVVYTPARRARLRELQRRLLLSIDGTVDYQSGTEIESFFRQLIECAFVPDPDALVEQTKLQLAILGDQADRMFPLLGAAVVRFSLAVSRAAVDDLNRSAAGFLQTLQVTADLAWKAVQEMAGRIAALERRIERAARDEARSLDEAGGALSSSRRRNEILDAALLQGIEVAERTARAAPGFDLLPPPGKQAAIDAAVGTFRAAFGLVRPALQAALGVLGNLAGALAQAVEDAVGLDDALVRLGGEIRDRVEREVARQVAVFGVGLPPELGGRDLARLAADLIRGHEPLRQALRGALNARDDRKAAEGQRRDSAVDKARAEGRYRQAVKDRDEEVGGPLAVRLLAPAPVVAPPGFNWLYRGDLRVRLAINGARLGFVDAPPKRRVWLALNGRAFSPPPSTWSFTGETLRLNTLVPAALLRRGLNVLEASVVDGRGGVARAAVSFAWQPGSFPAGPEVAPSSRFVGSGPLAATAQNESLTLVNRTSAVLELTGWSVLDEARNRFVFPHVTLASGASVTVITGRGPTTGSTLYWQRTSAVWDDTGDTVYLVDPQGVLSQEFAFGNRL